MSEDGSRYPASAVAAATPTPIGTAREAAEALALRGVRSADDLSNPVGGSAVAVERSQANALWWHGLTPVQRRAVIATYPLQIGNAEGFWPADRDVANRLVLQGLRDRADQIRSKLDEFGRVSRAERRFLERVDRLDLALQKAAADARRAGVDGALLLAFDPRAFSGGGRIVVSFGADPYLAESVSWHVPGVRTTMHSLVGFHTRCAIHHLQSTMHENPHLSAASIAWIGYDTPSGLDIRRAVDPRMASDGGDILFCDIRAFNTARETWAAEGSRPRRNHVFGYSYGSTVTSYAGRGGRLADHVETVTLIGSPGAGPLWHASDFGIGEGNVFVASSSSDRITTLGGRTPGSAGRILGRGLGADPAMESFGAVRISAEFPDVMKNHRTGGTHHAYFLHDPTSDPPMRSESLSNLGRIAAGGSASVRRERHRTCADRRTPQPAIERVSKRP